MKTGFYIGRFQPFHRGHMDAVTQALEQADFLIIGIGSSQESGTSENPWTAAERRAMIETAFKENGIPQKRYRIVEIPDINNNPKWPAHVQKLAGDFKGIFTGSDIVGKLFETHTGLPVFWLKKNLSVNATTVRRKIRKKEDLTDQLTPKIIAWLKAHPITPTPSTGKP